MRAWPLLLLLFPTTLPAQHCGYDFYSVIVLRPHALNDTAVVQGLRITLLDSNNVPLEWNGHPTYIFRSNADLKATRSRGGHGTYNGQPCCFPFAKDNYVLVVPSGMRVERMKVLVQDERDPDRTNKRRSLEAERGWPPRFHQAIVPLAADDMYPLCGTYDEAEYPDLRHKGAYHPVDITLHGL